MRIYIVNIPSAVERLRNLEKRLRFHGFLNSSTFVQGVTPEDQFYSDVAKDYSGPSSPQEAACFLSHLKAINLYITDSSLSEDDDGCIIMEDDQVLCDNFSEHLAEVMQSKPIDTPLVMLSRYQASWDGCHKINEHLFTIGPQTYSSSCYWISRHYAKTVIETYAKPFTELTTPKQEMFSELITLHSGGAASDRLLTMSECQSSLIGSNLRNEQQIEYFGNHHPIQFAGADAAMEIEGFINTFNLSLPRAPIHYHNWWTDIDPTETHRDDFFASVLRSQLHKYREVHVYNAFGPPPPRRNERSRTALYVQYSGETHWHDPYLFDLNFIPTANFFPNIVPICQAALYWNGVLKSDVQEFLALRRVRASRATKFACIIRSNGDASDEADFFHALSIINTVDSAGRVLDGVDCATPGRWLDKNDVKSLGEYRFVICFEKTRQPYYITEQLLNAYAAGSVPVYCGCRQAEEVFNRNAFLSIDGEYSIESRDCLIKKILELEADPAAYQNIFSESLSNSPRGPDEFCVDSLAARVGDIMSRFVAQ
jgi:GR25 family glycosyltransferase involved in LPS biosynthesis